MCERVDRRASLPRRLLHRHPRVLDNQLPRSHQPRPRTSTAAPPPGLTLVQPLALAPCRHARKPAPLAAPPACCRSLPPVSTLLVYTTPSIAPPRSAAARPRSAPLAPRPRFCFAARRPVHHHPPDEPTTDVAVPLAPRQPPSIHLLDLYGQSRKWGVTGAEQRCPPTSSQVERQPGGERGTQPAAHLRLSAPIPPKSRTLRRSRQSEVRVGTSEQRVGGEVGPHEPAAASRTSRPPARAPSQPRTPETPHLAPLRDPGRYTSDRRQPSTASIGAPVHTYIGSLLSIRNGSRVKPPRVRSSFSMRSSSPRLSSWTTS